MPKENPYTHKCGPREVDFTEAMDGHLYCRSCGATWLRTDRGWNRNPKPTQQSRSN